jgi:hypothetical protein
MFDLDPHLSKERIRIRIKVKSSIRIIAVDLIVQLPYAAYLSKCSLTSTQRMLKGGSRCSNPRSGGFEHEVTNFRKADFS